MQLVECCQSFDLKYCLRGFGTVWGRDVKPHHACGTVCGHGSSGDPATRRLWRHILLRPTTPAPGPFWLAKRLRPELNVACRTVETAYGQVPSGASPRLSMTYPALCYSASACPRVVRSPRSTGRVCTCANRYFGRTICRRNQRQAAANRMSSVAGCRFSREGRYHRCGNSISGFAR